MCGDFIRWLRRKLNRPKKVEKDNKFVEDALSALPNYDNGVSRMTLDAKFWMVNKEQMRKIVKEDMTDKREYQKSLFDCDNVFSHVVNHLADTYDVNQAGIILDYSGAHAYNVIVYPNKSIELFEPQTDRFFDADKRDENKYPLKKATVLM